jgi:hypothetical protein
MDPPDRPECRGGRDMRAVNRGRGGCGQTKDLTRLKTFLHTRKMAPPASIVRRWAPRDARVRLDEPYIAVHFNLDCGSRRPKHRCGRPSRVYDSTGDWMLFRSDNRWFWRYVRTNRPKEAERIARQRCSRPRKKGGLWASHQIPAYVDAVAEIRRRPGADAMPIVLITSIGKPGHEATQWVVDAFVKRLPEGVVVTQGGVASAGVAPDTDWAGKNPKGVSRGVGRELAAAAELGVLRGAAHAVLVTGSTFSAVARKWRQQANQSEPIVISLVREPGTRGAKGGEERRRLDACPRATAADADLLAKHFAAALGPSNETCDEAPPANGRIHVGFDGPCPVWISTSVSSALER